MKHSESYPFVVYQYADGSQRERTEIPIQISNPATGAVFIVFALIDTGADGCVFPKNLADKLGHDFSGNGVKSVVTGGIGGKSKTLQHTFKIELLNSDRNKVVWSAGDVLVDCIDQNIPPLIGVKDFMKDFELRINYPDKTITLFWD